jgi:branched-chain amino acid transport system permease protein
LLFLFLKYTYLGKAIRATSQDNRGAKLMGVNIRRVYIITLGIGSACVGVAGALLIPIYYAFPNVGLQFVLIAFVCVVLGGMGNITGAFFGGLIIGVVESFSGFFIAPDLKEAVYFIIFVLVLLIKPSGLFGLMSK